MNLEVMIVLWNLYLLDAIVITLEYITDKLMKKETLEETTDNIEDEITEEMPKQKPDFGTLWAKLWKFSI